MVPDALGDLEVWLVAVSQEDEDSQEGGLILMLIPELRALVGVDDRDPGT